jgi:putative tricarboxylic transport membrane protein
VINALRGPVPEREPQNFVPVIVIVAGLLIQMALLRPLGFSVATGILFATVAYGFGERRIHLTLPFGLVLAGLVWFIFARLLKLTLPEGPWERWVVQMFTATSGTG